MSAGTRLALSGLAAAAAAAALTALAEGTAAAETPVPHPVPVTDAAAFPAAPVALHGQFAGAAPGPAAPTAPVAPAPPALVAAALTVPPPVAPAAPVLAEPVGPAPAVLPAAAPAPEVFAAAAPGAAVADAERPVVLVPVPADTTTVPTLLSATVPAGTLPGLDLRSAAATAAADPAAIPGAVVVPDAIPGPAPSRALVLTPGPAPAPTLQVHPLVAEAAVDKSAIIYDAHPVEQVTDADIHAGLTSAGVHPQIMDTFAEATRVIIGGESGGSTNAVNRWDSNAHGTAQADGAPGNSSRGLMQTIPSTFAAYHAPGTSLSIYDPHANIAAAWRYINSRYNVDLSTGNGLDVFMGRGTGRGVGY